MDFIQRKAKESISKTQAILEQIKNTKIVSYGVER